MNDYLKIEALKNHYVYEIKARNAKYGIWIEDKKAFLISRWKFKRNYLFLEYHWDIGEQFGTVKPKKLIEKTKFEVKEIDEFSENETKKMLSYLDSFDEN